MSEQALGHIPLKRSYPTVMIGGEASSPTIHGAMAHAFHHLERMVQPPRSGSRASRWTTPPSRDNTTNRAPAIGGGRLCHCPFIA